MKELSEYISALQRLETAMNDETRVMTCGEAAFVLGKAKQTISRYINEGRLHKATANGVTGVLAKEVYQMLYG